MVAVFDIREYVGVFQMFPQVFRYTDVVDAPAFVIETYTGETLAPPGIAVWLGMIFPESIHPAMREECIHPFSFIRQKAR